MTNKSDIAVSVRGLSKSYTISHNGEQHSTLAESLLHKARNPFQKAEKETFWALKDVDFDIQKGDVVGIIGRNGAGKSTLLKVLSRITEPTHGKAILHGRVGSLLEVGTGFHAELTGRENIFLNGAILGMSKREIAAQFDAIVDFSGVEQFLDTPVKRYSSGMYVRLAFAVAAHLNPEIMIVDEVLAVGDAEFQKKCLGKMQDVAQSGRTVLFVSHNMSAVQSLCSSGVLLQNGQLDFFGDITVCVDKYLQKGKSNSNNILSHTTASSEELVVTYVSVDGSESDEVEIGSATSHLNVLVEGNSLQRVKVDLEAYLLDWSGVLVGQFCPTRLNGNLDYVGPGKFVLNSIIDLPRLNHGSYTIRLLLNEPMVKGYWDCPDALMLHVMGAPLANGISLEGAKSGPLLLSGKTEYIEVTDCATTGRQPMKLLSA